MKRLPHIISYLAITITFILLLLVGYWSFYPYKMISFNNGNATILNKVVERGGYVQMHQSSCKYTDDVGYIDRQFIDGIIFQVPTYSAKRNIGCFENIEIIHLPEALPAGNYYIRTTISYKVNPIRTVSYTVVSEQFEIIEP